MRGYFPRRLFIANLAGRALICDAYLIAEWRADPWKGFDLPEGAWELKRGGTHQYDESPPGIDVRGILRSFDGSRADVKGPATTDVRRTDIRKVSSYDQKTPMLRLRGSGFLMQVDESRLDALVRIIGGEPESWRTSDEHDRLHAYDGDHWLGTLMALREWEK